MAGASWAGPARALLLLLGVAGIDARPQQSPCVVSLSIGFWWRFSLVKSRPNGDDQAYHGMHLGGRRE